MTNQPPEYPDYGSVPGATPPPPGPPGGSYGPPYQPPPPGYGYAPGGYGPPPRASQEAVWSMILGISSLVSVPLCCGLFGLGVIPAIAAIIMGVQSKREVAESGGTLTGAGQAQAGFITGIIGGVLCVLAMALLIVLIAAG